MSNLKVNGVTYAYPDPGTEPGWGGEATGWAEEVTAVLDSLAGDGTIFQTTATINNNMVTPTDIAGMIFNEAFTKSAEITYRIEIRTDSEEIIEQGELNITYYPSLPQRWVITQVITGGSPSGVGITIDTQGQVKYTSEAVSGLDYVGLINFKTIAINS